MMTNNTEEVQPESAIQAAFRTKNKNELSNMLIDVMLDYEQKFPLKWTIMKEDLEFNKFAVLFEEYWNPIDLLSKSEVVSCRYEKLSRKVHLLYQNQEVRFTGELSRIRIEFLASEGKWESVPFTEPSKKIVQTIVLNYFNAVEAYGESVLEKEKRIESKSKEFSRPPP